MKISRNAKAAFDLFPSDKQANDIANALAVGLFVANNAKDYIKSLREKKGKEVVSSPLTNAERDRLRKKVAALANSHEGFNKRLVSLFSGYAGDVEFAFRVSCMRKNPKYTDHMETKTRLFLDSGFRFRKGKKKQMEVKLPFTKGWMLTKLVSGDCKKQAPAGLARCLLLSVGKKGEYSLAVFEKGVR